MCFCSNPFFENNVNSVLVNILYSTVKTCIGLIFKLQILGVESLLNQIREYSSKRILEKNIFTKQQNKELPSTSTTHKY